MTIHHLTPALIPAQEQRLADNRAYLNSPESHEDEHYLYWTYSLDGVEWEDCEFYTLAEAKLYVEGFVNHDSNYVEYMRYFVKRDTGARMEIVLTDDWAGTDNKAWGV